MRTGHLFTRQFSVRAVKRKQPLMSNSPSFRINVPDFINSSRLLSVSLWQPERIRERSPDTLALLRHSTYGTDQNPSSSLPALGWLLWSFMPISGISVIDVDVIKTADKFLCMSLSIKSSLNSSSSFSQHFISDITAESSKFSHPEKQTVVRSLQLPFAFTLQQMVSHLVNEGSYVDITHYTPTVNIQHDTSHDKPLDGITIPWTIFTQEGRASAAGITNLCLNVSVYLQSKFSVLSKNVVIAQLFTDDKKKMW